jgi:hypothetical protein
MSTINPSVLEMEKHIDLMESHPGEQGHIVAARQALAESIVSICELTNQTPDNQLSDLINSANSNHKGRRETAILVIRALSIEELLPLADDHQLARKVVDIVETGFADQCKSLRLSEKRQTYEKINALKGFHESICGSLQVLKQLPTTLEEIDGVREDIQKALRNGLSNAYLQPYYWTTLKGSINHICEQVSELVSCKDNTFKVRFDQLLNSCRELDEVISLSPSFLNNKYLKPFLVSVQNSLHSLQSETEDQFTCTVDTRRRPPRVAEKRYPLHLVDKLITITIPLINNGPGLAIDLLVELDCGRNGSVVLDSEEIHLGDIPPGEFAVSFKAMIVQPIATADMAMQISWSQLFGTRQSIAINVQLTAQDSSIDWSVLEQLDPYSLEVAEGDKFVGRKAKVQAIGNRLLKAQMSSTYITGQKRIGKTSLAQAVLRYVNAHATHPIKYESFYLEWGEYCAADAAGTIKALGEQLYYFLKTHLPHSVDIPTPDFQGSLAPLNTIAKLLESSCPDKRFIIVLDEFDEIHPEMYRFGALAEAFFANLRTLAARKNLAFILVGGEKMPFIISAQGDQLNKFVREPLDYFSRSDEWTDYVELVTGPVKDKLNWEESALNELFSITNGHPYYTKLLCARVFSTAVGQRDTEIIASDIRHALNGRVSELDTNSFAHFWKDGINAEREAAEIVELKRLRVLVAFGRTLRLTTPTKNNIPQHISTLPPNEVGPIIEDFCRRDIMKEHLGDILMQLPILQRWILDVGVSKLISSTLADDLESELQKANDNAYVKAGEIEQLVKRWPLYRGHEITGESIRAWIEQVSDVQEQRMLFTILQNINFVTTQKISELLKYAHERVVARSTPPRVRDNKTEKRRDLLITYLDGPGKSGSGYARLYAKENDLLMESVVEPDRAIRRLQSEKDQFNALVIVDDISGTGRTLSETLEAFFIKLESTFQNRTVPIFLVVMYATELAEQKITSTIAKYKHIDAQLHVCEILTDENSAFPSKGPGFWKEQHLKDRAKALCIQLGTGLYKDPLGFGSQSLMIAFPDTCPNNALPILFATRSGKKTWLPLLPRPAS